MNLIMAGVGWTLMSTGSNPKWWTLMSTLRSFE
jgi:hypothetical protein